MFVARWLRRTDLEPFTMLLDDLGLDMREVMRPFKTILTKGERQHSIVVLLRHGDFAGFLMYKHNGKAITINNIAVVESVRRQGGGKVLMDFMLEPYRGEDAKPVRAVVSPYNVAAQKFFSSLGFKAELDPESEDYVFKFKATSKETA
jgi:ribosomal protein S18 acetylase RimI-like enzyme